MSGEDILSSADNSSLYTSDRDSEYTPRESGGKAKKTKKSKRSKRRAVARGRNGGGGGSTRGRGGGGGSKRARGGGDGSKRGRGRARGSTRGDSVDTPKRKRVRPRKDSNPICMYICPNFI